MPDRSRSIRSFEATGSFREGGASYSTTKVSRDVDVIVFSALGNNPAPHSPPSLYHTPMRANEAKQSKMLRGALNDSIFKQAGTEFKDDFKQELSEN